VRVGSLFAGIGGFDLAARWMGWETAWFSEIDPYASAVLAKHWPGVPNHGDITTIDFTQVGPVDLLCGGFPCQDISKNSPRASGGINGERSGLWREYLGAIRVLRPHYVVVENVPALFVRGFERVLGDLAALGYDAEWEVFPACAVGAPQSRDRLWVLAYPASERVEGDWPARVEVACLPGKSWLPRRDGAGARETQWEAEPSMGRLVNGIPAWVDRLRGLGNAIVPQCALVIFQAIQAREDAVRLSA
jgi:DNA (cytosine-5)-methyltransferase 1